jgi:AraC-like DNA-binding protein
MEKKTVIVDETLLEKVTYTPGEVPILRRENHLDEFLNGEINRHWHSEFLFGLLLRGKVDYYYSTHQEDAHHQTIGEGDGFFINSRVLHGCRQLSEGSDLFTFGVVPTFFTSPVFGPFYQTTIAPLLHSVVRGAFFLANRQENRQLLDLFGQFWRLEPNQGDYPLCALELLCQIWWTLLQRLDWRPSSLDSPLPHESRAYRTDMMVRFIRENYQRPLTVEDIAQSAGVSRRECFRCFKELRGSTPTEFLTNYRLSIAAYLLATTNLPIAQVGEACGFGGASYFTRLFKERYGMTPRTFRK